MLRFSFTLPSFLQWLLPASLRSDLERRSALTGKASRSFLKGIVEVKSEVQDERNGRSASLKG